MNLPSPTNHVLVDFENVCQILADLATGSWQLPRMIHSSSPVTDTARPSRVTSIDALRGLVMFMMILVNDLAGAGKIVPDWMVHFSDRHQGGSGMTTRCTWAVNTAIWRRRFRRPLHARRFAEC
ncbi:MAG TPA: hypothetical protein VJA21_03720 [Verrucomicrobiae bacterium]